jgi:hypothetical protein
MKALIGFLISLDRRLGLDRRLIQALFISDDIPSRVRSPSIVTLTICASSGFLSTRLIICIPEVVAS